jgi:hypothetical protein
MQREPSTEKAARGGPERRKSARANADLPITVMLPGGKCEARIRDISRTGVCFFLDRPIPLMTVLQLALPLRVKAGVRNILGLGAVVRCERISKVIDHYEIAVFLHEMAETDRDAIEAFVAARPLGNAAAAGGAS